MFRYQEAVLTRQIDNKLALLEICLRYPIVLSYTCSDYLSIGIVTLQCERIGCSKLNQNKLRKFSQQISSSSSLKILQRLFQHSPRFTCYPCLSSGFEGLTFMLLVCWDSAFVVCIILFDLNFHTFSHHLSRRLTLFSFEMFIWPPTALKSLLWAILATAECYQISLLSASKATNDKTYLTRL